MQNNIIAKYQRVNRLVEAINDQELTELSKFLGARLTCPDSYAVMLGETSSGKTTLLNGLLRGNYLYTSVKPSTGAVIELVFQENGKGQTYYAINKNATMEKLVREDFTNLSKMPDNRLNRLRMEVPSPFQISGNLRLFDTPGYGSLIDQHEQILSDFLSESNLVLYVVNYKVGIQQDDFNFLSYAKELVTEGTEFVIIINRVPEGVQKKDPRIEEIMEYARGLLHTTPKLFLVPNIYCEGQDYPLPRCEELWDYVQHAVMTDQHKEQLEKSFELYIHGLLKRCESIINKRVLAKKISDEDKKALADMLETVKKGNQEIKEELIEPTFSELINGMPSRFQKARSIVEEKIHRKIDDSSKLREDEIITYVNSHMMQFETKKQVDEIRFYIEAKLNELDRRINDRLNKQYAKIENTIELHFSVETANMMKGMFKSVGGRALEQSLMSYFKQFAGKGGTGIANASKHLLKKFGDLIGKTFSRETHNKLASTLSKIGATSAKAVGIAVTVIIDLAFTISDIMSWQGKLKKNVTEGVDRWYKEVVDITAKDLTELKEENIRLIDQDTEEWFTAFQLRDQSMEDNNIDELLSLLGDTKKEVGDYNNDEGF